MDIELLHMIVPALKNVRNIVRVTYYKWVDVGICGFVNVKHIGGKNARVYFLKKSLLLENKLKLCYLASGF